MSKAVGARIEALLDEAEAQQRCAFAASKVDAAAFERRAADLASGITSPLPGLYVRLAAWRSLNPAQQHLHTVRALAQLHPTWTFCGVSAALACGLWVSWHCLDRVHVACGYRAGQKYGQKIARHGSLDARDHIVVGGLRCTPLRRTIYDCLRTMRFSDGLAIADSALRRSHVGTEFLRWGMSDEFGHMKDGQRVVAVCGWADARSESGGESIARACMIERGIALPSLQVELPDRLAGGTNGYRVDFAWTGDDGRPIFGELDGKVKYTDPALMGGKDAVGVLMKERQREARLTAGGVGVARFGLADVLNEAAFDRIVEAYGIPRGARPPLEDGVPTLACVQGWVPGRCGLREVELGGVRARCLSCAG